MTEIQHVPHVMLVTGGAGFIGVNFLRCLLAADPAIRVIWLWICVSMLCSFLRVSWPDPSAAEAELNAFLREHRVLKVRPQFVEAGEDSFWSFCVEDVEARVGAAERPPGRSGKERIDYRERLKPDEFQAYLKLRELRKDLATQDTVPVYLVFTNDQLSQIASIKPQTKADLGKIDGVGATRVEKYGERVIAFSKTIWAPSGGA